VVNLTHIGWKNEWLRFRAGWDIPEDLRKDQQPGNLLLAMFKLKRIPRDLRHPELEKRFTELLEGTAFFRWWLVTCGNPDDKVFQLNFPDNHSTIPWELLISSIIGARHRTAVCLTRTSAHATIAESPSVFDEPMRNLILLGDDGASIGLKQLNLQAEVKQIQSAWEGLEGSFQKCVMRPEIQAAKAGDLRELLEEIKPHILWFSGHGLSKPETALLFADGEKITAKRLAGLIESSRHRPLYAVFWACDTGGPDARPNGISVTPALFAELSRVDILAVLAMQAPIRDVSARAMTAGLFRLLGTGMSLEHALAHTRVPLIDNYPSGAHPLDWACPVIWSASDPVENLKWSSASQQSIARFQLAGRWALRLRLEQPAVLVDPPSADERTIARAWSAQKRTWIFDPTGLDNFEDKQAWLRTLQAIPYENDDLFVLPVILGHADAETALRQWSHGTFESMRPGDVPREIVETIQRIRELPIVGWKQLCQIPRIYLAVANPPHYDPLDAFWKPLLSSTGPYVNVVSSQDIPRDFLRDWAVDKIEAETSPTRLALAIGQASRLARALAILNMPLSSDLISIHDETAHGATRLADWENRDDIVVQTSAGPVIRAVARQLILDQITEEETVLAHRDCVAMMMRLPRLTLPLRERLVVHYLGANQPSEAVYEVMELCSTYHAIEQPFAAIRAVETLAEHKGKIPSRRRLVVAAVYLQVGMLDQAQRWLDLSQPQSVLEKAWKHGMQHEIFKSEGIPQHRDKALEEIETAIRICEVALRQPPPDLQREELEKIQRALLVYRQDRARMLQYFFADREQAVAEEYSRLIRELSTRPGADLDLAAVKRNYSELLRKRAKDPRDAERQQARELLGEAEDLARKYTGSPILAEVLYEKAKLAEADGRLADACDYLNECIEVSGISNHTMLRAIAQNRRFWKCEQFALARWFEIEKALASFRHGWALRSLIDARLRVSKTLEGLGDLEYSLRTLEANAADLVRNPSFDQGSDRSRILRTFAGLVIVNEKLNCSALAPSDFSVAYPWFKDWYAGKTARDLDAIWQEVA